MTPLISLLITATQWQLAMWHGMEIEDLPWRAGRLFVRGWKQGAVFANHFVTPDQPCIDRIK